MKKKRSKGVNVFCGLLIFSSLYQINTLIMERDWYFMLYSHLPEWLMVMRYSFSWLQRILGLSAAIGMLMLKDFYRKLALVISVFSILTLYWKHPYTAFQKHTELLDKVFAANTSLSNLFLKLSENGINISFSDLTVASMLFHWFLDIIFFGSLIYFLTRKEVKGQFLDV